MRKAISIVHVPELNVRTWRPPKNVESCLSNSKTLGPLVSQPERSVSATEAMVASSIDGRENGRNSFMPEK
jgi:hypothetical protein